MSTQASVVFDADRAPASKVQAAGQAAVTCLRQWRVMGSTGTWIKDEMHVAIRNGLDMPQVRNGL